MTDFDFEILSAIAQYGKEGVECKELEQKHFKGYDLLYTLEKLSKVEVKEGRNSSGHSEKISCENSACLRKKDHTIENVMMGLSCTYTYYSITDRGRSLLQNWQRRQNEKNASEKCRRKYEILMSIAIGIGTGIIATIIYSKILGL